MLNKSVCKKCCKSIAYDDPWGRDDDIHWKIGDSLYPRFVHCPLDIVGSKGLNVAYVDSVPPKWCPRKLEHAVSESVNIDKKRKR